MIQSVRSKRKRKDSDDEGEAAEVSQRQISADFVSSYLMKHLKQLTAPYYCLLSFACQNSYVYAVTCSFACGTHFDVFP